jgi:hypothetical protein
MVYYYNYFLNIVHIHVFYSKHHISETGFCIHLQVEPTQLSPIDRAILSPVQT